MRKWNAVLSAVTLVLFLFHAIGGALGLMSLNSGGKSLMSVLSWVLVGCVVLHALIGIKLTIDTCRACKKSGVSYFRENKLFWARRVSGLAIFLFIFFHVMLFMGREVNGAYRLNYFGTAQFVMQLLLVLSIAVHVLTNVKPSLIAFGIKSLKEYAVDLLIALSVLFIFMGAAFFVYYMRWQ